jgi:hypothetical protein
VYIKKEVIDSMLEQLATGRATGATSATFDVTTAKILLDAYAVLAAIREHPGLGATARSLNTIADNPEYEDYAEVCKLLLELLFGGAWTPTLLEERTVRSPPSHLRIVK